MAKKQLATRPSWSIPLDEDLAQSVPGKSVSHIENHHEGLQKIEVEAIYMNDAGAKVPQGTFQTFELPDSGRGRVPAINALTLAQIVWARCEEYAAKKRRKVVFIVMLFGSNAKSIGWKHRFQFTIDGTPDDMTDDESEQDSDDFEDDEEDGDGDEERREDNYGNDMNAGFVPARPLQIGPSPIVAPAEVEMMPNGMMPGGSTALEVARTPAGQESVLVASLQRAYSGANAEHRALVQQVRMERAADMRDMKAMFSEALDHTRRANQQILDFMETRLTAAEARANQAETRIVDMSKLEGAQRESLMEVTQQGWIAFIEGMRMKAESVALQQEYDRAFLGLQLQNLQSGQRKSAAGGALKSLLPFAATGISAILRARGDEASAATIDSLSKTVMKATLASAQQDEYEEDEESEGPLPPIVVAVRQLHQSFSDDQKQKLRAEMPKAAWRLFEGAARADLEEACVACLSSMHQFLKSDASLQIRVFAALGPEQQQQLMAIVQAIQGGPMPAQAAPTPATPRGPSAPSNGHTAAPFGVQGQPAPSSAPRRMPPRPGGTSSTPPS